MCPTEKPLDAAGHPRSPVTMPGYHQGRLPKNKGLRFPADPPTVEEIVAVMSATGNGPDGARLRALIIVLWRAGLRISEALALTDSLDQTISGIQHIHDRLVTCGRRIATGAFASDGGLGGRLCEFR